MKRATGFTSLLLAVFMTLPLMSPVSASASIPTRRTLQIGLVYGSTAVPSANLQHVSGGGFEFGYYDANLNFTAVASTNESKLSVMVDRNLQYTASPTNYVSYVLTSGNGLTAPASGSTSIGFAHVQINSGRSNLASAQSDIAGRQGGFIRYNAGSGNPFVPMYGNFSSSGAASTAGGGSVNTGTSSTITVAATGTNRVLFEFDNYANKNLLFGIRPMGGGKPTTWCRGYQYYGGFRYERRTDTALTVANIVNLEDYVQGVVPNEMGPGWPLEALKAQAICARTYVLSNLNKHSSHRLDLCTGADCQVYRGRNGTNSNTDKAVTDTAGQVVTHGGKLISTYYSSSNGGGSESNENIWAGSALPYLRGVLDEYEAKVASSISQYNWSLSISQSDITQRVKNAGHGGASTITSLRISQYSPTGNVVSVVAKDSNGKEYTFSRRAGLQALFGATPLRSQRFDIGTMKWSPGSVIYVNPQLQAVNRSDYAVIPSGAVTTVTGDMVAITGSGNKINVAGGGAAMTSGAATGPTNGSFVLTGKGWGHSVGMSQWGAYSQALHYGRTAEQIIKHYFTGVEITKI